MVILDYSFDPEELKKLEVFDFEKLTGTDLDYHLFCGSIFLRANGISFDASWKWIPIFDFCVRMNKVVAQLQNQKQVVLEFTENEATIVFERENSFVRLKGQYANADAQVLLQELKEAVRSFSCKLVRELIEKWPMLLDSAAFQERLQIVRASFGEVWTL